MENSATVFQNGDVFSGGPSNVEAGLPQGRGTYEWAEGGVYTGDWKDGLKHGLGTYRWPSGAVYEGEWVAGHMHGKGVFTSRDGAHYDGSWQDDLKHGLGKKRFPNGDTYEGLWKGGQAAGPGLYKWASGNEYNGEWVGGKMNGRGTFVWASGERYDGDWRDGREHGRGTFTWADSSYFDGYWRDGEKHGVGIWAPPPGGPFGSPVRGGSLDGRDQSPGGRQGSPERGAGPSRAGSVEHAAGRAEVMLREYDGGRLVREELIPETERPKGDPVAGPPAKKRAARREVIMGETIYKGAPSYDLMLQLQLGIRWSVGRVTPEHSRNLTERDFTDKTQESSVSARFPRQGSSSTPPHAAHDFKWKDYCPMVFRKLRERFGIDAGDYMLSLCGDQALRELSSPGKSGSVFFLSQDGHFIVKTMRKAEMVHLRHALLPTYFRHVIQHKETLLTKFFGLHRVKPHGGNNVRFVVMGNLFCTSLKIHRRFDLKGSTYGRLTKPGYNPETKILKDLDLDYRIKLEGNGYAKLVKQIAADCELLAALNIMDYSLLLGVHFLSPAADRQRAPKEGLPDRPRAGGSAAEPDSEEEARLRAEAAARLPKRGPQPAITRRLTDVIDDAKQSGEGAAQRMGELAEALEEEEEEEEWLRSANPVLGENMPAVVVPGRVLAAPKGVAQGPLPTESRSVVLNFGIIDILQEYNLSKQVEHGWKTIVQGQQNVSSVNPQEYSKRFQDFMAAAFTGE